MRSEMYSPTRFYTGVWLTVGGMTLLVFAVQLGKYIAVYDKKK